MKRRFSAPKHLSKPAREWVKSVLNAWVLERHHELLLIEAATVWDRLQQARTIIDREGITFTDDRGNARTHPACAVERDSRIAYARLLRELDLDCEPPSSNRVSPPALRSNRRGV